MPTANQYDIGDSVRVRGQWFDTETDEPADPTTVTIEVMQPDGEILVGNPVRASEGVWYADFPVTQAGWHDYKVVGTGAVTGVDPGGFLVRNQIIP